MTEGAVDRGVWARLLRAGLLTAVVDGLFSSILSVAAYHSTVTRLFQGVASVLLGSRALEGGTPMALVGIAMHVSVAFWWSGVFLWLAARSSSLRSRLQTTPGTIAVAAAYGPFVWMAMSLVVIPVLTRRPPAINFRWWVQFVGHAPFVGLPIVASVRRVRL